MNVIDKHGRTFPLVYRGKGSTRCPAVIRSGLRWFTAGFISGGKFHNIPGQNGADLDLIIGAAEKRVTINQRG